MTERPGNLGERLRSGAKWSGAQLVVNVPVRLGTLAILARLLRPSDFGVFAAAITVIEFARPIGTLSLDYALVQSKELGPRAIAFASWVAIGVSSMLAGAIAWNADVVLLLYDDPGVPELLVALALTCPFAAASGLLLAMLRRRLAFRELSIISLTSSVAGALVSVVVAFAGGGVWALVAGYYVDLVLRALFALPLVRPRFVAPGRTEEVRGLMRFGVGTSLSAMLNFWALHGDYVVIGSALGPKPLGYYSRAYQLISTIPGMLGRLHNAVLFPAFSRAQSDRDYLGRALQNGVEATAALTLPLCAWGVILGPEIIAVLLGPGWEPAIAPFQVLALGAYFRTGYRFAASIVMATGHVFALSACQAIYGALIVIGAIVGSAWGITGVAVATLLALLVFYVLLYGLTARVSHAPFASFFSVHVRPTAVFIIVAATAFPVRISLMNLGWPPVVVIVVAVAAGGGALVLATRLVGRRLWGEFLHEQGLAAIRSYTARREGSGERDDVGT